MNSFVTIIIGIAVLALFIWAVVFSIKSSRKIGGCSGGCGGCPYASGCDKTAQVRTRDDKGKSKGEDDTADCGR
ncbi:MAG: FeoB-associated Cys-rich membrane protein [Clostridia bacterium]|nr:FeoB-associated Cys-rich membrane protein [Clostridia bacterium]